MKAQSPYLLVGGIMVLAGSVTGCYADPDSDDPVEELFEEGESSEPLDNSGGSGASCTWYKYPSTTSECTGCSICLDRVPATWNCASWTQADGKKRWDVVARFANGEEQRTGCK